MEAKTYIFQPEKKFLKQGNFVEDEAGNLVYEFKMLTQPLIGAMEFEFVNHLTGTSEKHKVSHTTTTESSGLFLPTVKSWFKLDGTNIWDYLHEKGIRLDSHVLDGKIGADYDVSLNGNFIGRVGTYSPSGENALLTSNHYLKVETIEEYLDLVLLVAFAISRTDQAFLQ